ncbi:unnamed protein product [Moneuplotes crassus]|uniref:non-specific serine/threonine protein kinase n=1 Tax=Euplotes crassus TaxID=5936 RepID=A0AAD1X6V2_EUPCR|nr:unnamed protein product [Moneuplotes crassus]
MGTTCCNQCKTENISVSERLRHYSRMINFTQRKESILLERSLADIKVPPPQSHGIKSRGVKVDINVNIITNVVGKRKSQDPIHTEIMKGKRISMISSKPPKIYCTNEADEKQKYDLGEEEEIKMSKPSVSDSSSSDSSSEYNIHQASLPKIKVSKCEENKEEIMIKKRSNAKVKFDPKNLLKEKGSNLEDNYEFCGKLGKGTYGEVLKLRHIITGEYRACKSFIKANYKSEKISLLYNEVRILKMMDHPNIVKVYDYYEDSDRFHIVMEYCEGGELFEYFSKSGAFTEDMASHIMKQILSAIAYLHSQNIIHSDLKAENIMFYYKNDDDLHVKLIDFGMATKYEEKKSRICGTPYYIAPEVLKNFYDSKADIWSLGVLIYILLVGIPPFKAASLKEVFKKILQGKVDFNNKTCQSLSEDSIEFIKQLLTYDPAERPSAAECLKLPWIKNQSQERKEKSKISTLVIKNLKKFTSERKLEIAVISYIANFVASSQNNQVMRDTFQMLDKDNDGVLSKQELINGLTKVFGKQAFLHEEIDQLLDNIDLNGNGVIDYSEFVTATSDYQKLCTEKNLKTAFDKFDLDGNGEITLDELREVLCGDEDDEDIRNLIKKVDKNGDGQINFEEFKDMMLTLQYIKRNSMVSPEIGKGINSSLGVTALLENRRVSMF